MKQVVISGIGVVSPNGIGNEAFKKSILEGRSGISKIECFDASGMKCQVAGQIILNGHAFSKKEQCSKCRLYE